jgi:hypothetical protein
MKGQTIIVSAFPKGVFLEGIISGAALLPGAKMELKNGVLPVGGRHTWQGYGINGSMANNDPRLTAILTQDTLQGFSPETAYVAGQRCFMYCPLPGEEMNVLVAGQAGTGSANAFTIGERLEPQVNAGATAGQYIQQSTSANKADFISMEHIDEVPDTATLVWAIMQ